MHIDFPLQFVAGRTASIDEADHVRELLELILFTSPGERLNRPGFGCGILQKLFDPTGPELAEALQFAVQGEIHRWIGDLVEVRSVLGTSDDSTLILEIEYVVRSTNRKATHTFTRAV